MDPYKLYASAAALGYDCQKTAVIEFTAVHIGELSDPTRSPAALLEVERRLQDMVSEVGSLPVEGRYWRTVDNLVRSPEPNYEGPIDLKKAVELGLYQQGTLLIRIYIDGAFFPSANT